METDMTIRNKIGSQLREIRKSCGLSQEDVAEQCGIQQTTISKIEAGRFSVSIDMLSRITSVLNADIEIIRKE